MKKVLFSVLSLMLLSSLALGFIPQATATNWSEQYLYNLVNRKVMQGDKYGNLYPDNLITRAEFSALLNRAFGFTEKATKTFKDVPTTAWYASDINVASNQGYMQGSSGGANPTGYLTREEAATMLCRALKIPSTEGESFQLSDERSFSNWSRGYINAAVNKRFVSGYPDGTFKPSNHISRGEAAKMLSEVAGEIVTSTSNKAGRTVYGNLTIASSAVTLSNVTVRGDLYITEGVGLGYVNLKNVSVLGEMIISGAGESNVGQSSITLTDCSIPDLIVDVSKRKILTLKTNGTTAVENTVIKSTTYLEELNTYYKGFDKVSLKGPSGTVLNLKGKFGDVTLLSPDAALNLYKGQATSINVDEAALKSKLFLEKDTLTTALYFDTGATVTGTGKIESVLINNDGTTIAQLPDDIYIRPGVTATINGKKMTSLDAEMDSLDPKFSSGYPKFDPVQPTDFTALYKTNKPGKVYYAVYPYGSYYPTTSELMATSGPKDSLKYGNLSALPDKEGSVKVSGLKAGTQYLVCSLFVDLRGEKSSMDRTYVQTVDNVVPVLLSGYPKLSSVDKDRAFIALTPNKNTSYYWAVLPKQAVVPTVDQLYQQTVSGALSKGVTTGGIMNTNMDVDTSKAGTNLLSESVDYVFYVVLRDSTGNMSKTPYKLSFTTKDLTAPSFYPEDTATEITYPKVGSITTTSIPFDFMVNEACTVYWSAVKTGIRILPLQADSTLDYTSDKAKDIIKSGTGATKFGKSSAAKPATKYSISVTGLEQQMPYDFYFMLEDKDGNRSTIKLVTAKTKDTAAPTASVSSAQEINGFFSVDRPITLSFSEIVCTSDTDANGNFVPFSTRFAADNTALANYIRLMDTSQVPEEQATIDWSKVTVKDVDAKTVVTFNEGALTLSNNNSYRFDLGYMSGHVIKDTSRNEMRSNTALPFKTVPPLTYFSEVKNINSSTYDAAFLIRPDAQKTGAYIYFDVMLRSDYRIEFKLYKSTTDIAGLTQVGAIHTLEANYATPLSSFVGQTTYESLVPTYYAIKLTKIGSTDIVAGQSPVTANVNLQMNAVIGNLSKLGGLLGDAASFNTRLASAIARGDVSSVTAPTDPFPLRIALVDSIPPTLSATTTFTSGDTQVVMKVKPDKECDVYYLAMPKSEDPATPPSESSIRTTASNPVRGIAAGSFHVPSDSSVATEYTITGLLPPPTGALPRDYVIYYFLKGAAPSASPVEKGTFTTIEVTAPKVTILRYTPETRSVKITTQWDSNCTVFYVVYPKGAFASPPTADQIMNPSKGPELIASGSFDVKKDTALTTSITSTNGLEYTSKYSFYAVAQKYIGNPPSPAGLPSSVAALLTMSPRDTDPPAIAGGTAEYLTPTVSPSGTFSGVVGVTFSEALYYFEQGSSTATPLTGLYLGNNFTGVFALPKPIGLNTYTEDSVDILDDNGEPTGAKENCLRSISFNYTNIASGTTIEFAKTIGDRALNYAGTLKLTFRADPSDPTNPTKATWTAQFIPANP